MMRVKAAMVLLVTAALAACDAVPRRDIPTDNWVVESGGRGSCSCPIATERYLVNRSAAVQSTVVKEHRNLVYENGSTTESRNFNDVPGNGGKRFLRCSAEPTPAHVCGAEYSWTVGNYTYHYGTAWPAAADQTPRGLAGWWRNLTGAGTVAQFADARQKAVVTGETVVQADTACVARCRGNDPTCLRVDVRTEGRDYAKPFYDEFRAAANGGQIPVSRLLGALGEARNVCERSDVLVQGGTLSNTGLACTWTGPAVFTKVSLAIPEHLAGRLSQAGGLLSLTFPRPLVHGPSVRFEDAGVEADFGGFISRADEMVLAGGPAAARYLVLTGPKNCVALRTN